MRHGERAFLYGLVTLTLLVALRGGWPEQHAAARSDRPRAAELKIAVCDVYQAARKLLDTDKFKPAREAKAKDFSDKGEAMNKELTEMAEKLKDMSPKDEEAQKLFGEYQRKQREAAIANQRFQAEFDSFFSSQFVQAYEQARAATQAVADKRGYPIVVASRTKEPKITADAPQRVIEAVLARPIVHSPEADDITDDVLEDLKLE
ncbi:MAG: OmpH family outer membrane protein [Phycisphaerae bacterium]|nr:OmpH family outer membrane protein [Phycisphaerae bacterium]